MAGAYAVPILIGAPVAALGLLSAVSPLAATLFARILDVCKAIAHMLLTTEGSFKKELKRLPDPDLLSKASSVQKVNLILIRHGESEWNAVFNKDSGAWRLVMIPLRIVRALYKEAVVTLSGGGSVFLDSPLNEDGVAQAKELSKFLESQSPSNTHAAIMTGGLGGKSVVVSSNLRRCIETAIIGLWGRFGRPSTPPSAQQQLVIMSDLQEASANVDTYSLSKPMGAPPLTQLAKIMDVPADRVTKMLEVTGNGGQKKMFESGLVRLLRFAAWCFDAPLTKGGEVTVIVSGHSLFFRTLFQAFLPHAAEHLAKTHKIANAGAVAITLERGSVDGVMLYRIPTASIQTIYGGWSK